MYTEENNYCEVLISPDVPKEVRIISVAYIAAAVVCVLAGLFLNLIYLLLAVLCLVIRYTALRKARVEYEYQFWGRQLDVDRIQNSDKRKHFATYHMDNVEIMARADDPILENYRNLLNGAQPKKVDLTDRDPFSAPVYLMYVQEPSLLEVRLQPSREMLRQMWRVAPRQVLIPEELKQTSEDTWAE